VLGSDYILGAVGVLQFDVTISRLLAEYGVEAIYEPINYATARWISSDDNKKLDEFTAKHQGNLAMDAAKELAYLADSEWRLGRTMEQNPEIVFHKTREHR